MAGSNLEYLSM
uniref:Uncharacterized protein n=1 Tax=Anguilla anguilla TaxID=7936 RepID=A0A0E9XIM6_ANGAN